MAYFSPLPPARTGIADYSRELLPALAERSQITLFAEHPAVVDPALSQSFLVRPARAYATERWRFDVTLYQIGNSLHHEAVYRALLQHPGVVVLHEHNLHHFMIARTIGQGNTAEYIREMAYALGLEGSRLAREVLEGRQPYPLFDVPLNERILDSSLGVIVHSQYLQMQVRLQRPDLPVQVVPAPVGLYLPSPRRHELGWPEESIIFACVGQVTPLKHVDLVLRALARLRERMPQACLLIVGEWLHPALDFAALTAEFDLHQAVRHLGFIGDIRHFMDWVATADVVLNLRHPTVGETSATALRALAAGRPLIVFDQGWYRELPDDACLKVAPMSEEELLAAMRRLAEDAALRARMGRRAADYARQQHHPARAAEAYLRAVQVILSEIDRRSDGSHRV